MFNSAMIAGISAIIEPRGPDSDQMRWVRLVEIADGQKDPHYVSGTEPMVGSG
jgi:hypothetical protein